MHVVGKSMNEIYRQLCGKLAVQGKPVAGTRELLNSGFTLLDIEDNIASVRTGFSLPYMLGELAWYFSGRDDLRFISAFSNFWDHISDDGETCRSGYGAIVFNRYGFDQLKQVEEILRDDPCSRRAVINFNVPNPGRQGCLDEICTIALVFDLRDGKLDCTCVMRSNDIWFGVPYDVVFFTSLQKVLADRLGVGYGEYTHYAVSLHVYDRDLEHVREIWVARRYFDEYRLDIGRFLGNLVTICEIAEGSAEPKREIIAYCMENDILMEVSKNEDQG